MDLEFPFDDVFKRIKQATGMKNQQALAVFLGITSTSVSRQKQRNIILTDWVMKIAVTYDLSIDWLLYGTGTMKKGDGSIGSYPVQSQFNVSDNADFIHAVEMLAKIYLSGNQTLITAIDNNLKAFSDTVDAKNVIAAQGNNNIERRVAFLEKKFTEDLEAIKKSLTEIETKPVKRGEAAG